MSVLEAISSSALDGILAQAGGSEVIRNYARKLREGYWSRGYVDAIGTRSRGRLSEEETAVFANLHTMIFGGLIGEVLIQVGASPRPDHERKANADALALLPRPFTAAVEQGQFNDPRDGILTWDEPIEIQLYTGIPDGEYLYSAHYMIPPGWAPLEIGNSPPSRSWLHLVVDEGTLARWPYGQEWVRLFVNFDFIPRKRGRPLPITPG